jgi:hypothetical protein
MILCLVCPTVFKRMMAGEPKEKGLEETQAAAKTDEPGSQHEEKEIGEVL